jgi:hypothetical protein
VVQLPNQKGHGDGSGVLNGEYDSDQSDDQGEN